MLISIRVFSKIPVEDIIVIIIVIITITIIITIITIITIIIIITYARTLAWFK